MISESVALVGTIRTFNREVRQKIIDELERACSIVRAFGGDYSISYEVGYPPTVNNAKVVEIMRKVAVEIVGEENVVTIKPKTWSEDFSYFADMVPGAFMFLGGKTSGASADPTFFPHHTPTFDIEESGLWLGSAILAETAERLIINLQNESLRE